MKKNKWKQLYRVVKNWRQLNDPPKKSKWQQRLEETHKKWDTGGSEDSGPNKVNLHNEDTVPGDDHPTNLTARPIPLPITGTWIPVDMEKPPYYTSIDIWDGWALHEDWHRVSNGDYDYYCNNKDDKIIRHISYWAKRPGEKYIPYDPMRTIPQSEREKLNVDDKPILSTNDVKELIKEIKQVDQGGVDPTLGNLIIARITGLITFTLTSKTLK